MPHPATERAMRRALEALGEPIDLGFIFPPLPPESKGRGIWQRELGIADVISLLPRAAAANVRGANIYMRIRDSVAGHPGVVLLDDLSEQGVTRLASQGFQPVLTVETSPSNYQAWIRLCETGSRLERRVVQTAVRTLAMKFNADPRAVSAVQPGRAPGFTNRKQKYADANGRFPFARIVEARPGHVAPAGYSLLGEIADQVAQGGARAGRAPATEAVASHGINPTIAARLDAMHAKETCRIADQVTAGCRPPASASRSEIDFAVVVKALAAGIDADEISAWLAHRRPDKDHSYPWRTINAGLTYLASRITNANPG